MGRRALVSSCAGFGEQLPELHLHVQVAAIHGDLSQDKRTAAIIALRDGSVPLLVATDVAARGLDIPDVALVLNFSFPLTVEDYCHRIGRTGRAGKTGQGGPVSCLQECCS